MSEAKRIADEKTALLREVIRSRRAAPHPTKPQPAYAPDHPKNLEDGTPCQYVSRAQPADITAKVERSEIKMAFRQIRRAAIRGFVQPYIANASYIGRRGLVMVPLADVVAAIEEALSSQRAEGIEAAAVEALEKLTRACERADCDFDLSEHVDGSLLDAANDVIEAWKPTIWTAEQVEKLKAWQEAGWVHPLTCANDHGDEDDELLPTTKGLLCPMCDYRQTWAPECCLLGPGDNPFPGNALTQDAG